ncbi:membrane protein, partial [Nannochloropsis gaditana CCMP526]|uniref:uncharacterized protein n=1 Tax=Nannochloropsis gaditana (strain CCMP526) TaxID=1093141 RepID=UPI00029F5C51
GFRPFKSLREENGDVVLDVDEPHQPLIAPLTSQFFAGFQLRELDDSNMNTFLKDTGKIQKTLRTLLWFAYLLWPYIGFGIFSSILAQLLLATVSQEHVEQGSFLTMLDVKDYPDLKIGHGFIGSILGFSIAFRTNAAYDRYYEGRKILSIILENSRSILRDVYSFLLKAPAFPSPTSSCSSLPVPDDAAVLVISSDLRRRLNILFAFIRQSVRESLSGFSPNSDMGTVSFSNSTFYLDPSLPHLLDLLSKEEAERYAALSPRARPGAVSAEINIILQILSTRMLYADAFLCKAQ